MQDLPLFAKAGSILPTLPLGVNDVHNLSHIVWTVYPGSGSGYFYEDNTQVDDYRTGNYAETNVSSVISSTFFNVTIDKVQRKGTFWPPASRETSFVFPGLPNKVKSVQLNGADIPFGSSTPGWDTATTPSQLCPRGALRVRLGTLETGSGNTVSLLFTN